MKKLLKILAGIGVVIIIAVAAAFYFTADLVDTADDFFVAIKKSDMEQAYSHLSEDFRAGTSTEQLQGYLQANSLDQYASASWGSRSISGGRGTLNGSVTTESGGVIPITLGFVKGDGGWRIHSLQKPPAGIQEETSSARPPTEQEQVALVAETMLVFAQSVNDKSMAGFHQHISSLWRNQYSVEKLDEAFKTFYDLDSDLTVLQNFSPQFSGKPTIDDTGSLVISGHYPTQPSQVHFEQTYIYEGLGWKLIGLNVNIR